MTKKITRVDIAKSYETIFILSDDVTNTATEIRVPVWEANDLVTLIQATSWTVINNLFNIEGSVEIKSE